MCKETTSTNYMCCTDSRHTAATVPKSNPRPRPETRNASGALTSQASRLGRALRCSTIPSAAAPPGDHRLLVLPGKFRRDAVPALHSLQRIAASHRARDCQCYRDGQPEVRPSQRDTWTPLGQGACRCRPGAPGPWDPLLLSGIRLYLGWVPVRLGLLILSQGRLPGWGGKERADDMC
jgi:hypothetical protein